MMSADDMWRLHHLLIHYQGTLQEGTDEWARCNLVLLDLTKEILNRKYGKLVETD